MGKTNKTNTAKAAVIFVTGTAFLLMFFHMIGIGLVIDAATITLFVIGALAVLLWSFRTLRLGWPATPAYVEVSFLETLGAIEQVLTARSALAEAQGKGAVPEEVKISVRRIRLQSDPNEVFKAVRDEIEVHLTGAVEELQRRRGVAPLESFEPTLEQLARVVAGEVKLPAPIERGVATLIRLGEQAAAGARVDAYAARLLAMSSLEVLAVLYEHIRIFSATSAHREGVGSDQERGRGAEGASRG